ncbi:MAG: DUF4124 domain-containing protein [Gammaproteobacteria bacterium]|nr:DUF4124 domain-containing protein [Gammaproteobacteria bacterium]
MRTSAKFAILLAATALASAALAGTYRWVDKDGVTVYSQTPPPPGVEATTVKAPPAPPKNSGEDSLDSLKQQYQSFQDREDIRKERMIEQQEDQELQQKREHNCQAAKHNLAILQGPARSLIQTPDGEYQRIDEETRSQQIEEANKMIDQYCD